MNSNGIVRGINYVGLSVSNIEQTTTFFSNSTDIAAVDDREISESAALDELAGRAGVTAKTRLMRTVNAQLRLMQFDCNPDEARVSAVPIYGPGIAHICLQVAATTATYQKFLEEGARPVGDRRLVQLNDHNPVHYAYLYDRDGIIIEVEHVDFDKLKALPPNHYRIRHVSLATPDITRMITFYSKFLDEPNPREVGSEVGGIASERMDQVSGLPDSRLIMAWFQTRNLEIEIFQYVSHPTALPDDPRPVDALGYNMIVFDVTDLDAAQRMLVEAGGELETKPETLDEGEIVFGRDPDGNVLGLQVAAADTVVSSLNFVGNGT